MLSKKVNKSGGCHNLGPWRICCGNFRGNHLGLVFHVISIVCLRRALDKIHNAKFFAHGKSYTHRKIKSRRNSLVKKKEEKKKSSTLASIFRTKKSSSKQNLPYIMLKTRSPFIYASTSLDTNRNFERCLSIRCLAPQHIFQFFHFSLWYSLLGL